MSIKRLIFKTKLKMLEKSQKTFLFANCMLRIIKDLLNDKFETNKKVLQKLLNQTKN